MGLSDMKKAEIIVGAAHVYIDGVDCGYTSGGVTARLEREYFDVEADQDVAILDIKKTREVCVVQTSLLQLTLQNIMTVWDLTGTPVDDVFSFGEGAVANQHLVNFWGPGPDGNYVYMTVWLAVSVESGEMAWVKADSTKLPVTFRAVSDTSKAKNQRYGKWEYKATGPED